VRCLLFAVVALPGGSRVIGGLRRGCWQMLLFEMDPTISRLLWAISTIGVGHPTICWNLLLSQFSPNMLSSGDRNDRWGRVLCCFAPFFKVVEGLWRCARGEIQNAELSKANAADKRQR
jgi:hypothetical protein